MKSRSEIWLSVLEEFGTLCSVSTQRDAETLARRVEREGDSFLKVTLPRFAKDLEKSLAWRRIPTDAFQGFKRNPFVVEIFQDGDHLIDVKKASAGTPKFLGGFLDLVFTNQLQVTEREFDVYADTPAEALLHCPRIREENLDIARMADAITAVRQLCLMFGKEKERCSSRFVEAAYDAFTETDAELTDPLVTSEPHSFSKEDGSLTSERSSE
jgi:hypothetical protein